MQIIDFTNIKKQVTENHTSKGNQPKWHIENKIKRKRRKKNA